ncbi:MAG: ABC transporter permease [Candidatus Acidiferrales bacterium]
MGTLIQDVKYALRMLRKSPGFTIIAVLTIALGIGANTAIFSAVNAVLLKPLPFHNPDRLVELWETESSPGNFPLPDQDFLDWRAQNRTFEDMAVFTWPEPSNISGAGVPEQVRLVEAQANFFSVLGVAPQIGRAFVAGEDVKGLNHVAIVTNAFWKSHFGGRADALNKTIQLNGESYTIIGVMPAWYTAPGTADVWTPIDFSPSALRGRDSHYLRALGRVKAGVTIEQARADLGAISARLAKDFPKTNSNAMPIVVPMQKELTGESRAPLWTLFGAVGLVLLIACANVANLLLARSIGRRREMALRGAVGASRWRLVRQLLTESVILALAGGALGALIAYNAVDLLVSLKGVQVVPPNPIRLDVYVLFFCFAVSAAVGILFGLAPAFQISELDLIEELKSRSAGAARAGRSVLLRDGLVAVEIALSLALLAGAGLLLRTFSNLRAVNLGLRTDHVITGYVMVPDKDDATFDQAKSFIDTLLSKLKSAPGIRDAAFGTLAPLSSDSNGYVTVDGQPQDPSLGPLVAWNEMTPGYFHTLGIRLLAGRELNDEDVQSAGDAWQKVLPFYKAHDFKAAAPEERKFTTSAIISKGMAAHFWPKQDPIGKIFRSGDGPPYRVVGVVEDVRNNGLRDPAMYAAYIPTAVGLGDGAYVLYISVLTDGPPQSAESTMRSELASLNSTLALSEVKTIPQLVGDSMADTNDEALLLGALAGLALLLAAVGTYGVMSYVVSQRTNEIGIRMALGAQRHDVVRMVLRQGGILIGAGVGIGLLLTLGGARLMKDLLFGVAPFDALTYVIVSLLLAGIAFLACAIPARRAMRVDPMVALRYE